MILPLPPLLHLSSQQELNGDWLLQPRNEIQDTFEFNSFNECNLEPIIISGITTAFFLI